MPRLSRSRLNLSEEEKKKRRREQKTCVLCDNHTKCAHFGIGQISINCLHPNIALEIPGASSPETASASTESAPGTPQLLGRFVETPSPELSQEHRSPLTPRKRYNFEDIYSDDSTSLTSLHMIKRPAITDERDVEKPPSKKFKLRRRLRISVDSEEENSPPVIVKINPVIADDSDDENSTPDERLAAFKRYNDDSDENIF